MDQSFCPHCGGGNPPDAKACMWCHQPLAAPTVAPAKPARWASCLGTGLLVGGLAVGVLVMLLTCRVMEGARSASQEQSSAMIGALLLGAAFVLLVVPGIVLIMVSRSRR